MFKRGSKDLNPVFVEQNAPTKKRSFFGRKSNNDKGQNTSPQKKAPTGFRSRANQPKAPVTRGGVSTRALADTWSEKDNVGVQDFVMLENYTDVGEFMKNLEQRYLKDLIYTYIGSVCISVNPYRDTGIYTDAYARMYSNVNLYELPPHVFGVADQAYRQMRDELTDQCVLISGESGAGKTEASKKILQFLALNSTNTGKAGNIRDRLMETNAILEAFGNAKTIRNDNSSRFGKYMEVQFDFKGEPLGGRILNYLLEKSRVISQMPDERNFHVFYFLLKSSEASRLEISADASEYHYINQGGSEAVKTIDDTKEFGEMYAALQKEGFQGSEINALFSAVAFILELGQVEFDANGRDASKVQNQNILAKLSKLIGVPDDVIGDALTHRTIVTTMERAKGNLSQDKAYYARDALGKALYNRVFTWVVHRVNESIASKDTGSRKTVMGLLDIYGFEIMQTNSFEQFCINYCNEKLQQLFIELTLRGEQEEYRKEGIKWEPVKYFDNKIICEMVEAKHKGVISILDEECIRPGQATDETFLRRLNESLKAHNHFTSFEAADSKTRRRSSFRSATSRLEFRVKHYAGTVTYNVTGFLDKNNDLLFRDLKECMMKSTNTIISTSFPASELESKKRPVTAGTQFKKSLNDLVDILMKKTPSYVRCIKPNHLKAYHKFDKELVDHQVQYLGLMENLRVRRAGFAYRRLYEIFLDRYKPLSPQTWPSYSGSPKEGVQHIVNALKFTDEMYKMGTTKIFIRFPKTVSQLETAYSAARHRLATTIAAHVKGYFQRQRYLEMRMAATIIARNWKVVYKKRCDAVSTIARQWRIIDAKRQAERLKKSIDTIKNFIRGWIQRFEPPNELNKKFVEYVRVSWLDQLKSCLPYNVLDKSWITNTPVYLQDTSKLLQKLHQRVMVRKYVRGCTGQRRQNFQDKLFASGLFREQKMCYPQSVAEWFKNERLKDGGLPSQPILQAKVNQLIQLTPGSQLKYITEVKKFDRIKYKERDLVFVLTSSSIYLLEHRPKKVKVKFSVTLADLVGVHVSPGFDEMMILKTENKKAKGQVSKVKDKGDFVLHVPYIIEACVKISLALGRAVHAEAQKKLSIQAQLSHCRKGKDDEIPITLLNGPELLFYKDKKSKLFTVQTPTLPEPPSYTKFKRDGGIPKRDPVSLQFGKIKRSTVASTTSKNKARGPSGGRGRGRGGQGQGPTGRGSAHSAGRGSAHNNGRGGRGRGGRGRGGRGRGGPSGRAPSNSRGKVGASPAPASPGANGRLSRYSGFGSDTGSMDFEEQPMYEEVDLKKSSARKGKRNDSGYAM